MDNIILCENFNIKKFGLTELEINNKSYHMNYFQCIAYPQYNNKKFIFQTDFIQMTSYGIPKSTANNSEANYYNTDEQRGFIKIPNDPYQVSCKKLFDMLKKIDKYMNNIKVKNEIYSVLSKSKDIGKMFDYINIVKKSYTHESLDEDEKDYKKKYPEYCKVKLAVNYPSFDIKTTLFERDNHDNVKEIKIKTVTDLEKYITWECQFRMIVMVNKFWANKHESGASEKKKSGITLKVLQIEVKKKDTSKRLHQYAFKELTQNIIKRKLSFENYVNKMTNKDYYFDQENNNKEDNEKQEYDKDRIYDIPRNVYKITI